MFLVLLICAFTNNLPFQINVPNVILYVKLTIPGTCIAFWNLISRSMKFLFPICYKADFPPADFEIKQRIWKITIFFSGSIHQPISTQGWWALLTHAHSHTVQNSRVTSSDRHWHVQQGCRNYHTQRRHAI